jgi:D-3-phosphoglycerate dehydrogenase
MKVLIAEQFEQSGRDGLAGLGCEVVFDPAVTAEALPEVVTRLDPTVLVVRGKKVKAPAIVAGNALKLIIRAGAGYDNIDLQAATAKGVAVCNCPGMNAVAVAELVFGLLLACDRRIPEQCALAQGQQWSKKEYSKARGLKGLTLGLVGVGSIGREVSTRAKAFGMKVVANSLNMTRERAADLGVEYGGASRKELLDMIARCDAVSLHVSANPQSERLANAEFFAAMKKGAYFINTSRGSVVDEAALADAVTTRGVRAGLDVFAHEPAEPTAAWANELARLPGVYCTHHVGASTDQAQNAVAEEVVRIVKVYKQTGRTENKVN